MQNKWVGLVSIAWVIAFSLTSVAAEPLPLALQACQGRVEEELPETAVELNPGSELPNGTVVVQWQAANVTGSCRVAVEDGALIEFVNPYAVPRGQRPIENVTAFQTADYSVRIVRLSEQLYMNVYNRRSDRVELNRELVRVTPSEEETTYTNLLGQRRYRAVISGTGNYRLVINLGSLVVYDQVGNALETPAARIPIP